MSTFQIIATSLIVALLANSFHLSHAQSVMIAVIALNVLTIAQRDAP